MKVEMPEINSVLASAPDNEALFTAALAAATEVAPAADPAPAATLAQPVPAVKEVTPDPVQLPALSDANGQAPQPVTDRIAPKLLKLMEREATIVDRETKLKAQELELNKFREQTAVLESAQRLLKTNAAEFVRKFAPDMDLGETAKQLWYSKLGAAAPPEFRAELEARAARSGIDELRTELTASQTRMAEDIARRETDAAYHQYVGALGAYAQAVPDTYPLVKAFASKDPARVQAGLFKIAQNHAQATNGAVLTPAEAAAKLNTELEGLRSVLGVSIQPSAPPVAPAPDITPTSLRNKHQSVQPNRALPDTASEENKFLLALEAAKAVGT